MMKRHGRSLFSSERTGGSRGWMSGTRFGLVLICAAMATACSSSTSAGGDGQRVVSTTSAPAAHNETAAPSFRFPAVVTGSGADDGQQAAVRAGDGTVSALPSSERALGFSPDRRKYVVGVDGTAGAGPQLEIFDTLTARKQEDVTLTTTSNTIDSVWWSADGSVLLIGAGETFVHRVGGVTAAVRLSTDAGTLKDTFVWSVGGSVGLYQDSFNTCTRVVVGASVTQAEGQCATASIRRGDREFGVVTTTSSSGLDPTTSAIFDRTVVSVDFGEGPRTIGEIPFAVETTCAVGPYVALVSDNVGDPQTVLVDANARTVRPLDNKLRCDDVLASHDGGRVAYRSDLGVRVLDTQTGVATVVARSGSPRSFNSDSSALVLEDSGQLFRAPVDGSGAVRVSEKFPAVEQGCSMVAGEHLVFSSGRELFIGDLFTGKRRRLRGLSSSDAMSDGCGQAIETRSGRYAVVVGDNGVFGIDLERAQAGRLGGRLSTRELQTSTSYSGGFVG